jgi:hypothetical protein
MKTQRRRPTNVAVQIDLFADYERFDWDELEEAIQRAFAKTKRKLRRKFERRKTEKHR